MKVAVLSISGAAAGLALRYYYKWDSMFLHQLNGMASLFTRTLRGVSMPFICFSVVRGVDNFPPLNRRNTVRLLYSVVTTLMSMTLGNSQDHTKTEPELNQNLTKTEPRLNLEKQFLDWPNHLTLILVSFVIGCIIRDPSEPDFTLALHEGSKIILRGIFKFLYMAAISMSMVYMYNVSLLDVLKLVVFLGVVLLGLLIQGCVLLPLLHLVVVRKNPLRLMKSQILTMKKDLLFSFFPSEEMIGTGTAAELMNGTALYGAAVVLFINKLNGYHVEMPQLTDMFMVVLITCSQGRDGIPYTGPLTTWFLLSALNLPLSAVSLLLVPEVLLRFPIWLLNRLSAVITDEVANRWAPESNNPQGIELQSINLPMRNNSNDEAAL